MNSVLNLNTAWTIENFLNYIEYSFSDIIADWYDSLDEEGKNVLRMVETLAAMLKNYARKSKLHLLELILILKKKLENDKERLIT